MTDLRQIDLNLLVILDALLEERHVTRAAQRLGITQPAGSYALERCRILFGDELLERKWGEFRLTRKAEALRGRLRSLLEEIGGLLSPQSGDLLKSESVVRLEMTDSLATALLPRLHRHLRVSAPQVNLALLPWRGGSDAGEALIDGDIDLAVSVLPAPDDRCRRLQLFVETYRVVMHPDHPAATAFDLDRWLEYPHVLVSALGGRRSPLDDQLQQMGRKRRVGVVVPSFAMVPQLLMNSELIALLPTRCIPKDSPLFIADPPIQVEGFPVHIGWHRRNDTNPVVQHVAKLIVELLD